jgi:hypothetical protein
MAEGSRRTLGVIESQKPRLSGFIASLSGSGKLVQWQYMLAFVLGLRLARRNAGWKCWLDTELPSSLNWAA